MAYGAALSVVIVVGIGSRKYPWMFPAVFGKYPGDALWAVAVFCALGFLLPEASTMRLAAGALAISYADELSQLYQAPWINGVRSTGIGHLILGSTFAGSDMLAYTIGIAIGAIGKAFAEHASRLRRGREA